MKTIEVLLFYQGAEGEAFHGIRGEAIARRELTWPSIACQPATSALLMGVGDVVVGRVARRVPWIAGCLVELAT